MLPLPGQNPAPDPTEPETQIETAVPVGLRPVASVPKPSTEGAKQEAPETIEDRLAKLESRVARLEAEPADYAVLVQKLDDAGILRAHPAEAATPALRQE